MDNRLHFRIVLIVALSGMCVAPAHAARKMYWTDSGTGKIQRADLDGSNVEDIVAGLPGPATIALDLRAGKMYWADQVANKIQRANLDGSNVEDLVNGLSSPYGIALDLGAGQMYWTSVGEPGEIDGTIQRANLDGSGVGTIFVAGLVDPQGIALDPASFMMYWADTGAHKIQRALMNGFFVEDVFAPGNDLFSPFQIALDLAGGKVYWSGFLLKSGLVERANLDGSSYEPLLSTSTGISGPAIEGLALDLRASVLYYTVGSIFDPESQIERVELDRSNREEVLAGLSGPQGIALDLREPIPAISAWGMVVMTLLMFGGATILIAQGRKTERHV